MEPVPVYLSDETVAKAGDERARGVAYTVCRPGGRPEIFVKTAFLTRNRKQTDNILKHELTHAWFCRRGIQAGHDDRFRRKFREVGGIGN